MVFFRYRPRCSERSRDAATAERLCAFDRKRHAAIHFIGRARHAVGRADRCHAVAICARFDRRGVVRGSEHERLMIADLIKVDVSPLGDRVIVQHVNREDHTPGGVLLPQTVMDKPMEGYVLAIGPAVTALAIGQRIIYSKYSGTEVKIDGNEVLIISVKDVLAAYPPS